MEASIAAVEKILNYHFKNKSLLEDALTHSSYSNATPYERLEFLGDGVLGFAFTNFFFIAYPKLDQGELSLIRAANISTEKLARVAIKHRLFQYVRHNAIGLEQKVKEFSEVVSQEDDTVAHGGSVKAPKVLADIVESLAAAVFVDLDHDLTKFWAAFISVLEPIVTWEDLQQQPQPVTMLFEICQKQGKTLDIRYRVEGVKYIASIFLDGEFTASGSSDQKTNAKLNAVREALLKLSEDDPTLDDIDSFGIDDGPVEIEGAKQKLHQICCKRKWTKPTYELEKDEGPPHLKKFLSAVKIPTEDGILCIHGDEKSRIKEAENSAASYMIRSLRKATYKSR